MGDHPPPSAKKPRPGGAPAPSPAAKKKPLVQRADAAEWDDPRPAKKHAAGRDGRADGKAPAAKSAGVSSGTRGAGAKNAREARPTARDGRASRGSKTSARNGGRGAAAASGRQSRRAAPGNARAKLIMIGAGALALVAMTIVLIVLVFNKPEPKAPVVDDSGDYQGKIKRANEFLATAGSAIRRGEQKKQEGGNPIEDFKTAWSSAVEAQKLATQVLDHAKAKKKKAPTEAQGTAGRARGIFVILMKTHGFDPGEHGLERPAASAVADDDADFWDK